VVIDDKGERNKDKVNKGERNKRNKDRERKVEKPFKLEHTNRGSKLMNHLLYLNVH